MHRCVKIFVHLQKVPSASTSISATQCECRIKAWKSQCAGALSLACATTVIAYYLQPNPLNPSKQTVLLSVSQ